MVGSKRDSREQDRVFEGGFQRPGQKYRTGNAVASTFLPLNRYLARPQPIRWPSVALAVAVSSFPKLLVVLMWVWNYRDVNYPLILTVLCITSNAEALRGA